MQPSNSPNRLGYAQLANPDKTTFEGVSAYYKPLAQVQHLVDRIEADHVKKTKQIKLL